MFKRAWVRYYTTNDKWNSIVSKLDVTGGKYKYLAKDNILHQGTTTCSSEILSTFNSPYNATVITLLNETMDLIGKTNLDQFGMGSSTCNTIFGPSINPLFPHGKFVTGGSSGGSAAAVAADLCDFSLGTDTGGSVRSPASNCGVVGFKPTYGRISRWGVIPYAQSLDTVGIIAKNCDIIKQVFNIVDKYDEFDPTSMPDDVRRELRQSITKRNSLRNGTFVFGVAQELNVQELTDEVKSKLSSTIEKIIDMGHTVVPVSIPSIKKSISAYYAIATAEASSNLSRYDGIRYGKSGNVKGADNLIRNNRSVGFGDEVKRRIVLGNYSISSDSGDYYARANEVRKQLVDEFNDIFYLPNQLTSHQLAIEQQDPIKCDFLISPTTISKPVEIEQFLEMEDENLMDGLTNDILAVPMSLAGLPAISIPIKDNNSKISSQGIQICGQYGDDSMVLDISSKLM